jgi:tetratricopeptide (TPR) repeat protein
MQFKAVNDKAARLIASGFFIAYLFLTSCATLQTETLLQTENSYPKQVELTDVPFFAQKQYQCGPAALAMLLQHVDKTITPDELVPQIYLPERKGSLQIEILAAARQQDVVPYVLNKKLEDLIAEVNAQHPVLILQNLPKWHYAVVVGFDFETAELILRSGIEERHVVPMKVFERTWARAAYWAVVILAADELPQTAEEHRYIEAAAAMERAKKYAISKVAYKTALKRWPDSYAALMGLGNSYNALNEFNHASATFRYVTIAHPDAADAFNNLADTLSQLQRFKEAMVAAKRAVELGGKRQEVYLQTLKEIEVRASIARVGN